MPDFVSNASKPKRRQLLADNSNRNLIVPALILLAVFIADQITKILVMNNLLNGETVKVAGDFFQIKLIFNTGGALGTELGSSAFYLVSSILILAFVIYFTITHRNTKIVAWSMAGIAGGATGNIFDRIRLGKVVDFLDFDFFDFNLFGRPIERWWTFNIADAAITVGIIIILAYIIFHPKRVPLPEAKTDYGKHPDNEQM